MRFRIIPLEERIVLDAAGAVDVLNSYHLESVGFAREGQTADSHDIGPDVIKPVTLDSYKDNHHLIDAPLSDEGGLHLMVIDTNVKNADVLGAAAKDQSHVLYYDSSTTTLKQLASRIETALHGQRADSIAFVSEGVESGKFMLAGGVVVSLDALQGNLGLQSFWDKIGSMITSGGRIDLLACNVAGTEAGQDLVERIDALADSPENNISVAASADLTGNAEWGGNWSLEMGAIDAKAVYFDDNIQAWQGHLATLGIVKDINAGAASSVEFSSTTNEAVVLPNGKIVFIANVSQIWLSDGTAQGTVLVKDLPVSAAPRELTYSASGLIYFSAVDPGFGRELWRTNGTASGTFRVTDINPGAGDSNPLQLTDRDGEMVFSATSGTNAQYSLWGVIPGVAPKRISGLGYNPMRITYMDGSIYSTGGIQSGSTPSLDRYDGSFHYGIDYGAGAGENTIFYLGHATEWRTPITVLNNVLYFTAHSSYNISGGVFNNGYEIFRSDGTHSGTYNLKNIDPRNSESIDPVSSYPSNIRAVGNEVFFTVINKSVSTNGTAELWKTDGTINGTVLVKQFGDAQFNYKPGLSNGNVNHTGLATSLNGLYIFYMGGSGPESSRLWRSDGTAAGTVPIGTVTYPDVYDFNTFDNYMYYLSGNSIWRTNGTTTESFYTAPALQKPDNIFKAHNGIYFDGYSAAQGEELWFYGNVQPVAVDEFVTIQATTGSYLFSPQTLGANDIGTGPIQGILRPDPFWGAFHGTIFTVLDMPGYYSYAPDPGYVGIDEIYYNSVDANGLVAQNVGVVHLTIANTPAVAAPDNYYVAYNTFHFSPLANDTDANGHSLTPVIISNTAHGTLTVNPDGGMTYIRDANYFGDDSFTYAAHDGYSLSNIVTVNLLAGLLAVDDVYTLTQNGNISVNLLENDSGLGITNPDDFLFVEYWSLPANGSINNFGQGQITYFPNFGFVGTDSLTYRLRLPSGAVSGMATVTFNVERLNYIPVAAADSYSVNYNRPLNVTSTASGLLVNDTDANGDPLHAQLVSGPANGVLSLNANGTFSYTPNAGFSGVDTFTYKALDDFSGISAPATVSINVGPNPTIITNPDYYIATGGSYTASAAAGLLANDINPTSSSVLVDSFGPAPLGTVTINANGSFTWTAPANFTGTDSFGYRVYTQQDGVQYASSGIAYITVPSVSVNDSYSLDKNISNTLTISLPSQGVLVNDSGWNKSSIYGPLQATLVSGPLQNSGSVILNSDGTFTYTADSFYGITSFTYRSDYPGVNGSLATVSIVVNNSPVANNGSFAVNEDGSVSGAVSYYDVNPNGLFSTPVQLVSGVAHGTLNLQLDGNFTYTPAANYYGSDSFTYRVTDSFGFQSNIATVNITVNSVNDAPTFTKGPNITVTPNLTTLQTLAGWAKNISAGPNEAGQGLTFSISTDNDAIFAVLPTINSATGTLTYALNSGLTDPSAHATVTLTDAGGASTTQSFDFFSGVLSLVKDIVPAGSGSGHPNMTMLTAYHDKVIFYGLADGTGTSFSLFVSDGTEAGTFVLKNFNQPGTDSLRGDFERFTIANDKLYFGLRNELWATDGTVAGTYLVTTLGVNERFMGTSAAFNNEIYFGTRTVFPGTPIGSFYKSDGTAAGTQLVHTFASPQRIMDFKEMNGKLYFNANDVIHGFELWSTDGTTAGTAIVADINPGADFGRGTTGGFRETPVVLNNKLYFLADDGIHGTEVWYTDGTAAGTQMLADLNTEPGFGSFYTNSNSNLIVELNGELYIAATQATTPGLWKSDGTTAGTVLVSSVPDLAGASFSSGLEFTRIGDKLLFVSGDSTIPTSGYELWITDGTTAGTHVLKDIANSPSTGYSSFPTVVNAIGNQVFFYANDGVNGVQLWKTDGTEAGTVALQSVTGGKDMVAAGGNIFIPANLGTGLGEELYAIYGAFNQDPVAADFAVSLQEDNSTVIDLLANVQDPDTIDLDTSIVTGPAHGTLVMNPNGTYTYTPNAHYFGSDSFTYKASDGVGVSNLATVTLTISSVNDAPIANDLSLSVAEDGSALINLPISDVDHANLDVVIVSGPSHGALVLNGDGSYTYTPEANYFGADSFTYKAGDGLLESAPATVTINVTAVNDAPTADSFSVLGAEDTPLNISLQGRYRDIDSGGLTVSIIDGPAHGTLTPNGDGTYTYTPAENYLGSDSFTYRVNDGSLDSVLATVSIDVSSLNDAPTAGGFTVGVTEDTSNTINFAAYITDAEGASLTVMIFSGPSHGVLTSNADGTYTYAPHANYSGTDSFTYYVTDGSLDSNLAVVNITIDPVNDSPTAASFTVSAAEDVTLNISLQGRIADPDDVSFTTFIFSQPLNGTVTVNPDGTMNYKSALHYNGSDSFRYYVRDPSGFISNIATVTVNVAPVNDPPSAFSLNVTTPEDQPVAINLLQNVIDFDSESFTAIIVNGPTHGTLTLESNGIYTYTPEANYYTEGVISDNFTYKVNDGTSDSNVATVEIFISGVNDAPTVGDFQISIQENGSVTFNLLSQVNDSDSTTFIPFIASLPLKGTLIQSDDGITVTYTPFPGSNGTDSFQYRVYDDFGAQSNDGTITITINSVNDVPVANDLSVTLSEDGSASIDLLANVVDDSPNLNISILTDPEHGTLTLNSDGTYQYVADLNYFGPDSFTYQANDDAFDSNVATVSITVSAVNDAPTATNFTVNATEDVTLNISLQGRVADPDDINFTTFIFSQPLKGTATVNPDGTINYKSAFNENGPDSFSYYVRDPSGFISNIATITVNVAAVDDPPSALSLNVTTPEDQPLAINLLQNVIDFDSTSFTAIIVDGPMHGTLTLESNGTYTYTPEANYYTEGVISDSFTYKVNDGTSDSNVATVEIFISGVNDAPIVGDLQISVEDDGSVTFDLFSQVTDVDSNTFIPFIASLPLKGTLIQNDDGITFTYTPFPGSSGTDSFQYRVYDDFGAQSNDATVTITINSVNDVPAANDLSVSLSEDGSASIDLLANVVDDSSNLNITILTDPEHGTLTLNSDGTYQYVANLNYFGPDSFTYKANDGAYDSNIATVSITVNAVNDAPTASDASVSTNEDTDVIIDLSAYAQDIDSANLYFMLLTTPQHGFLSPNIDGTITYTPTPNYSGTDSFTFRVRDGGVFPASGDLLSNIATVTITIDPVNDAPTASDASLSVNEDGNVDINLGAHIQDIDSANLSTSIVSGPSNGSLTLNMDGTYKYTPNANFSGSDSFTFKANDGDLDSNVATVSISVAAVNDAPTASNASASVNEDGSLDIDLGAYIQDVDSTNLTTSIVSGPAHGTLTLNLDGTYKYTPNANYFGSDSFTFKANDGDLDSNLATVTINVISTNVAPVAESFNVSLAEDNNISIDLQAHISDADSPILPAIILNGPSHGVLTLNLDGTYTYTPNANYNGSDSFTYKANDGSLDSNIATVSISVTAVNDAPVANDVHFTLAEDGQVLVDLRTLISDPDNDNLTIQIMDGTANGFIQYNGNDSYFYIPGADYFGTDQFTYIVSDGILESALATVSFTITPVNNDAPIATEDSYATSEDTPLIIDTANGVLANDIDVDGQGLEALLETGPAHGSLALNADGSFTYTPSANYNGPDSFTYRVSDGSESSLATVSITVDAVNDAPTASNLNVTTAEDTFANITLAVQDIDSANVTKSIVSGPIHGTLSLNPDGTYKYTPNANYSGSDSFTYKANDGELDSNVATVSISVAAVNDAPTASNLNVTTAEDTFANISLAVQDIDSANVTKSIVSGPIHGTLSLNLDGTYKYTPNANYNGSDSFTYKANDGSLDSNLATVSISVTAVNDAPTASNLNVTTAEDTFANISLAAQDIDSANVTKSIVSGPIHGTLSLNLDGSYKYTPNANYNGSDSFTYKANDGSLDSNIATVSISVTPVNDAPVAANDSYNTNEDTPLVIPAATGVLANDSDIDNASLQAILNTGPTHGTLSLNANGSFTYTPNANFSGTDSFTYRASDGSANSIAAVSITVNSVNDAPVANNDAYTASAGSTLTVGASGVLTNDTDIDSTSLTAALVTNPAHGSLTLNADGSFSYTPTAGYTGADSFTYRASDGSLQSNIATVAINVLGNTNVAPVLEINDADRIYKEGNKPTIITTQADVIDPDSPTFTNGTLTVTISNNGTAADRLSIVNTGNVTTLGSNVYFDGTLVGTFAGGDGLNPLQVTFNSAATQRIVERVVRHIGYSNISDTPSTLIRTVTFQISDGEGGLSAIQSKQVEVLSVNDAPNISTASDAVHVQTNIWTALGGINISDIDSNSFTVTLQVNRGVLRFSDMGGLQNLDFKKTPTSAGLSTLQFTGTLSDVNLALSRLMYLSKYNYVGQDSLFIRVKDNNISSAGRPLKDTEEIDLLINVQ